MQPTEHCPECGAPWTDGQTCTDHFHLMLAWEWDHQLYDVHHLLVLCYHLQHPSLYSAEWLESAKKMLVEFQEEGVTPPMMRERIGKQVDSGKRSYKIKGTPESHGSYAHSIRWSMVAGDVVSAGVDDYYASVRAWADSMLRSLRASGNLR